MMSWVHVIHDIKIVPHDMGDVPHDMYTRYVNMPCGLVCRGYKSDAVGTCNHMSWVHIDIVGTFNISWVHIL